MLARLTSRLPMCLVGISSNTGSGSGLAVLLSTGAEVRAVVTGRQYSVVPDAG